MTVPTCRIAPFVDRYVARFRSERDPHGIGGYTALAELSGVSSKTLKRIANLKTSSIDELEAEAILDALDESYMWHVRTEHGGLADLNEALAQQLSLDVWAAA